MRRLPLALVIITLLAGPLRAEIVLKGDRLKLAFSPEDFHLTSFVGPGAFGDIAAPRQTKKNALWRVVLVSDRGLSEKISATTPRLRGSDQWFQAIRGLGNKLTVDANAPCTRSHRISRSRHGVALRLFWKGIDVGGEKDALDVTATVRIPKRSRLAYWTLKLKNRSRTYGIWEFHYPRIEIAPPDPDIRSNFFLNTYRMGEVVPDPFHADSIPTLYVGHNTKAGQFTALYGANGRGFFYGPRDSEGWQKRFDIDFDPDLPCARFSLWTAPLNLGYPGEDFAMRFPVVTGCFEGDWYDACQLYREWAIKQVWCRKGPVAGRDDIPQWLKDCSYVLRQDTKGDAAASGGLPVPERRRPMTVANNRDNFLRCIELFGKDTASVWYAWWIKEMDRSAFESVDQMVNTANGNDGQLVAPIPAVPEANRRVIAAGGYPMAYINAVLYDTGDSRDFAKAKRAAARDLRGDLYRYDADPQACSMCPYARWWQKRYARLCRRAVKDFGFKGVYWDSYGKDGYRCFARNHGHSYGGGAKWIQGERAFGQYVRKVIKQADPEAVTSAEASTEEFIDLVDTRLCGVTLRKHAVPIFSAVYHDYQLFYGRALRAGTEEPAFSMTMAYSFNIGAQFGRHFIHGKGVDFDSPKNAKKLAFLKALIEAKRSAKEFLNLGRMLRPPRLVSDVPTLTGRVWYRNQRVTLPAVLCSAWRSSRGDVALVFVNCSYDPVEFTYAMDPVEYGFPRGSTITRRLRQDSGDVQMTPLTSSRRRQLKGQLPGHGIRIIVLSE